MRFEKYKILYTLSLAYGDEFMTSNVIFHVQILYFAVQNFESAHIRVDRVR